MCSAVDDAGVGEQGAVWAADADRREVRPELRTLHGAGQLAVVVQLHPIRRNDGRVRHRSVDVLRRRERAVDHQLLREVVEPGQVDRHPQADDGPHGGIRDAVVPSGWVVPRPTLYGGSRRQREPGFELLKPSLLSRGFRSIAQRAPPSCLL